MPGSAEHGNLTVTVRGQVRGRGRGAGSGGPGPGRRRPDAIRIGVMLPGAAVYGFALAVIGVRLAAKIAESKLPDMCQVALSTAI